MKTKITFAIEPSKLRIGFIEAFDVKVKNSRREYIAKIEQETDFVLQPDFIYPDKMRKAIRSLLRSFGFQPSGRNRPASEFLVKDLQNRGEFNCINNIVDINNHISLISHLPISVVDLDKSGYDIVIRRGLEGEKYVFNNEGHELSLRDLVLVAKPGAAGTAFASPVKDSQATKVFEDTTNIAVIIYSSTNIVSEEELASLLQRFCQLLKTEADAQSVEYAILDATS